MKKIILPVLLALCSVPSVYAAERIEKLDTLSAVIEKSTNISLFSNNDGNFRGDRGRLGKRDSKQGYAVFKTDGAKEIKTTVYSDKTVDDTIIKFYVSEDNKNYSEMKMYRSYNGSSKVGYQGYDLVIKDIPENMNYVKIGLESVKEYNSLPQISEIAFSDESGVYNAEGLLLEEEFADKSLMYDMGANFRFEGGKSAATLFDETRLLRVYDITSAVKYKIKDPLNLKLTYFVMDGKGDVQIFASSYDGGYKKVPVKKTFPEHTAGNWAVVYLTAEEFPDGTEFIQLVCPVNDHAPWPPMLGRMEVRY